MQMTSPACWVYRFQSRCLRGTATSGPGNVFCAMSATLMSSVLAVGGVSSDRAGDEAHDLVARGGPGLPDPGDTSKPRDHDAVGKVKHEAHVVADENDRAALVPQGLDQLGSL